VKHRIRTDLDLRYIDAKVNHFLDISSFLEQKIDENQTAFKEAVVAEGLNFFDLVVEIKFNETEPAQSSLAVATLKNERPPPKKKPKLARI